MILKLSLYSQTFSSFGISEIKEISESELRKAYKNIQKPKKWIFKGKRYNELIDFYLKTNLGKQKNKDIGGYNVHDDLGYVEFKLPNGKNGYIIQEFIDYMPSYSIFINSDKKYEYIDFPSYGNMSKNNVYYAEIEQDCDFFLYCKWFTFDDKVNLIAEITDTSYDYMSAIYDEIPNFFCDKTGYYYLIISKGESANYKFYRITLNITE